MARHHYDPQLKKIGMNASKPFAIFTSDQVCSLIKFNWIN